MNYRLFKEVYKDRNGDQLWRLCFEKNRYTLYYWFDDAFHFVNMQLVKDNQYVLSHHPIKGIDFLFSEPEEMVAEEFYRSDSKLLINNKHSISSELKWELAHFDNPEFPRLGDSLRRLKPNVPHHYTFDEEEQIELKKYLQV